MFVYLLSHNLVTADQQFVGFRGYHQLSVMSV